GFSTHYGAARSLPRGRLLEGGSPPPTAPRGRFRGGDSSKGVLHALRRRAVASAVRIRASTILLRSPRGRRSWWRDEAEDGDEGLRLVGRLERGGQGEEARELRREVHLAGHALAEEAWGRIVAGLVVDDGVRVRLLAEREARAQVAAHLEEASAHLPVLRGMGPILELEHRPEAAGEVLGVRAQE